MLWRFPVHFKEREQPITGGQVRNVLANQIALRVFPGQSTWRDISVTRVSIFFHRVFACKKNLTINHEIFLGFDFKGSGGSLVFAT